MELAHICYNYCLYPETEQNYYDCVLVITEFIVDIS